jgi:deazaflavin-dependent oxidoreductase (nitroreductase family)
VLPAWGEQGRLRNWFHTKAGARFLNAQTAWFKLMAPRGYAVVTTTGRRTGRTRRSCVRAIVTNGRAIVIATGRESTDWLANLQADHNVTLRVGRRDRRGKARLSGAEEIDASSSLFCAPVYWFDRVASVVNQRGLPTARRIRLLHRQWCTEGVIVIVDFATP